MGGSGSTFIRDMITEQMVNAGIQMRSDEELTIEIGPTDDYQVDAQHRCVLLASGLYTEEIDT